VSLSADPGEAGQWRQRAFTIGGLGIVHFGDAAAFRRLEEAGIDLVVAADTSGYAPLDSALLAARTVQRLRDADRSFRLALLAHVRYPVLRLDQIQDHPDPEGQAERLGATLDSLDRYPSVAGYWLWDEPGAPAAVRAAAHLAKYIARTRRTSPLPYVNLYPAYVGDARDRSGRSDAYRRAYGADKRTAYARYLSDYLGQFTGSPAPLLSFDHYPFESRSSVRDDYFLSLRTAAETVARFSREDQRIPLWVFVQLSDCTGPDGNALSLAQIRFQVFAALAYGAKGIMYWTLAPVHGDGSYAGGLLDGEGRPTGRYADIRQLDAEVHRLGRTLFRLDAAGVLHTALGGQVGIEDDRFAGPGGARGPVRAVAGGDSACMVARLRERGARGEYLLVVNKDLRSRRSFRLVLAAPADTIWRVSRTDGSLVRVGTQRTTLQVPDLAPGGGELYRIVSARSGPRRPSVTAPPPRTP
jgi:hypothetical protein